MKTTTLTQNLKSIILALILVAGISYVSAAWTGPSTTPPDGNTPAPINVGGGIAPNTYTQTKSGILNLAHLFTSDLTVTNADGTVTNIPAGSALVADGANTGRVKWGTASGTGGGIVASGVCINGRTDQFNSESILSGGATCSGYTGTYNSGTIATVVCPAGTTKMVVSTQKNYNQGGEGAICVSN